MRQTAESPRQLLLLLQLLLSVVLLGASSNAMRLTWASISRWNDSDHTASAKAAPEAPSSRITLRTLPPRHSRSRLLKARMQFLKAVSKLSVGGSMATSGDECTESAGELVEVERPAGEVGGEPAAARLSSRRCCCSC
eukprot:Mycagemm_TRINITY_DN8180_c0_g1::TRINITY_DN8180_c0_g1_i1::g.49::m.49 type:complete len:138 gc:universal TRINITY_DN8180_c0_g1_i1:181-594(+)